MNLKEENEKLRDLLRRVYNYVPIPDQIRIDSALSHQAELVECPVCCSDEPHTGTCGSSDLRPSKPIKKTRVDTRDAMVYPLKHGNRASL